MKITVKLIARPVLVLTGASSGMGLYTARLAAQQRAKLRLVARLEELLRRLCDTNR